MPKTVTIAVAGAYAAEQRLTGWLPEAPGGWRFIYQTGSEPVLLARVPADSAPELARACQPFGDVRIRPGGCSRMI